MNVTTGYAAVNDTKLYYEVSGSGDTIVLIHGNGGDRRHWDDQFEAFTKGHRVLRYDVRGFGRSSMPVEGVPYSHHDDLKALMEHLGIPQAHICGLSMGCGIAVDFVLAHPEMASSLIAVGPWAFGYHSPATDDLLSKLGELPNIVREKGREAAMDYWMDFEIYQQTFYKPSVAKRVKEIGYDYSFWYQLNESPLRRLDPPAAQRLSEIAMPTLIVTSEHDLEACVEVADYMEKHIPNSMKVVIQDAGHCMNMDKPDEFNRLVLEFIEGL